MGAKAMLPLIDCILLTLGTVLGAMTQMHRVQALPVSVARVGRGSAIVQNGRYELLSLTAEGLQWKDRILTETDAAAELAGRQVVLRADRTLPTERTLQVVATLSKAGVDVSLEVTPTLDGPAPAGRSQGV